ncbi:FKBP-type peptidyl-prolyl cis-trans isomerase [Asanoa sp. WMMD1127]|uniref:FKBP-type peptidyl-prolyl cis-trans isomerase n=1 Tax=Asanoa sp. WMMD1127 TaxID=3016107 RepID=UPI00241745E0|nr:FKBP-type peptidyl-prolyl cis-trans isomerase [Asanoa sp. WMMD1127]MDG4824533.1 FKBP-type peptidyl-prolyl cis-trans isomerase [Asanoa sp. WMMD1127]
MSNRVVETKNDRRVAAKAARKAAAERAARAKRRRQQLAIVLAGLAVVAIVVAIVLFARGGDDDSGQQVASAPGASASAAPPAGGIPADADPALKTKPVVQKGEGTVTELKVTPLIEGTGPAAQNGQTVTVNYVGVTYADGKEFDASWNGGKPFPVQLGSGGVIEGWDKGLVGAKQGSRLQLDIPATMAYGEQPPAGYPPGALRFVVDVLSVQ